MASVNPSETHPPLYLEPTEVYSLANHQSSPIKLRIATGGAGQSGLIRAFALAFIPYHMRTTECEPFAIAWSASDTSLSFNSLALRGADLSITYHPAAEEIALDQGIADRREYAWRDHWMLVGPKDNPADLSLDGKASIYQLFKQLFRAAIATSTSARPVRFLSRYDKSANNIKESAIWAAIGQTPWSIPYSSWYHQFVSFPFQALEAAARLGEYMVTDRGSWLGVEEWVRRDMMVFVSRGCREQGRLSSNALQKDGTDDADDAMLNPAHVLVGSRADNKEMANAFVDWLIRKDGGQEVVRRFASEDGAILYSPAPDVTNIRSRL